MKKHLIIYAYFCLVAVWTSSCSARSIHFFALCYPQAADNTPVNQLDQSRIDEDLGSARPELRVGGGERNIERGAGSAGESLHNSSSPSSTAQSESSDESSSSSDSDSGSGSNEQLDYTSGRYNNKMECLLNQADFRLNAPSLLLILLCTFVCHFCVILFKSFR